MPRLSNLINEGKRPSRLAAIATISLVVIGGTIFTLHIYADTSRVVLEAESGTSFGGAQVTTDANASGGKYLKLNPTSGTPAPTPTPAPSAGDPVIAAAGDIGQPGGAQAATAAQIMADTSLAAVFVLGDLAYWNGATSDYATYFEPTWGKFKTMLWPSPGNHDYNTYPPPYYTYFNNQFGKYWSKDLGTWHIISLNSQEDHASTSSQNSWLKSDLAAHPNKCTLAFEHYPRFSSGTDHGNDSSLQPLWQTFYDGGGDVILAGHSYHYERFDPLTPAGAGDPTRGIRSWIVGTGGADLKPATSVVTGSAFRNDTTRGLLKLTLHPSTYDWAYVTTTGQTLDSGTGSCH